jgi:hypothetical protein
MIAWANWNDGVRAGVILGIIVGIALFVLIGCCMCA